MAKHDFIENDIVYDIAELAREKFRKGFVQRVFDNDMCLVKFEDKELPIMCINGAGYNKGIIRTKEQMGGASKKTLELLIENEAKGITKEVKETVNLFQPSLF